MCTWISWIWDVPFTIGLILLETIVKPGDWCQFYLFLQIQTLPPDPHEDFYYNSCYPVLIKHFAFCALLFHKSI